MRRLAHVIVISSVLALLAADDTHRADISKPALDPVAQTEHDKIDRELYPLADWWRALMVLGFMSGMRRDEMLLLKWDDCYLDESYVQLWADGTKGRRDERIPLHPIVVEHLRRIQDLGVLVFDWPFGTTALYDEFHRIQQEAGSNYPAGRITSIRPPATSSGFTISSGLAGP